MQESKAEIDKQHLYPRYDEAVRERVRVQNERMRWQNQLSKQVTHKALDEPLLEDDDMHVDARRNTTVSHTGLGWKELLLIGGLGLPVLGTAGLAGAGIGAALLQQYLGVPSETTRSERCEDGAHGDTRMVPRLRFGPEKSK